MENKIQDINTLNKGNLFISDEDRISILEDRISDLRHLCDNMNPYEEISDEYKALLMKNNIYETQNPFTITNLLLMNLEDSIEELHKLKNIPLD